MVVASGQEGKNCTTACKQCNGASGCVDINNAEDTTGSNTCSGACKYCSAGACTTVTCGEETYGTTCSGSSVCDNAGTCVAKASNGNACKVGTCTTCSPATSCTFCASGYCQAGGICGATSTTKTMCAYSTASGGGVVSAGESISPSDPYVASARGWSIPNYGSVNFPSYLELQTMYGYDNATTITNLSVVAGNGVYRVTASDGLTIAAGDSPPCDLGFSAVIFVDHDLTISRSFTNDTVTGNPLDYKNGCNSSLAFIVSGDINIAQTVNNIYGIFYAGGSIKTNE